MLSTAQDLAQATFDELEKVRQEVVNWGLSEVGIERVVYAVNILDAATAQDLARTLTTGEDRRESLALRLGNVRDLRQAIGLQLKMAQDADWLANWLCEQDGQASPIVQASKNFPS